MQLIVGVLMVLTSGLCAALPDESAMREKIVYYDANYETSWVDEPAKVARFFTERGFRALDAARLGEWMKKKAAEGAAGTVVVSVMGAVPSSIVEEPSADVTLMRYLKTGGRVVWFANTPMYEWQDEVGPKRSIDGCTTVLGIKKDRKYFYGSPGPSEITEEGKRWGVSKAWSPVRPVPLDEVDIAFVSDPSHGLAAVWLRHRLRIRSVPWAGSGMVKELQRELPAQRVYFPTHLHDAPGKATAGRRLPPCAVLRGRAGAGAGCVRGRGNAA